MSSRSLRRLLWAAPVVGAAAVGLTAESLLGAAAKSDAGDPKPAVSLPISQVVLFSSGVGSFTRSGAIEGDARVDLTFQENDINDLIKSMTLQDFGDGRVSAVSYDSREPVARTLASFALNLNGNPPLTQILTQARGEKVEVALQPTAAAQPGVIIGTLVGVEKQRLPSAPNQPPAECDVITIHNGDGVRAIKMMDVLRVKFANPQLDSEMRRALEVLALNHDAAKKAVSVYFSGEKKRDVRVGYVVEAPVWKTSYRLVLDEKENPYLQGWAVVDNPSDEDWVNVKMALISGRPISFKMDLYNPLYVPRPTVEPELFASLRPPAYRGGFGQRDEGLAHNGRALDQLKAMESAEKSDRAAGKAMPTGASGFAPAGPGDMEARRRYAEQIAQDGKQKMQLGAGVSSAATASQLGDFFQYAIDHPVSLARQKSALLPIVGKDVQADRLSIYNPTVQAKHPLLGVRFKNKTGSHLAQGPITVFEGSTYAGDARVLDVQPNEERLLAYAIDLGTEVTPQVGPGTSTVTGVWAQKGIVYVSRTFREEKVYKAVNRSGSDRQLVIEHPNRTNQRFKIVETPKAVEETPDLWRFQTPIKAGQTTEFKVVEERPDQDEITLTNSGDDTIRFVMNMREASAALKAQLQTAIGKKGEWDAARRELSQVAADLQRIALDQDRIRRNLRETPKEAPVYKEYLDTLGDQEKEIKSLTKLQKELMATEFAKKKTYEDFLYSINDAKPKAGK
jgi:hypothetical protein